MRISFIAGVLAAIVAGCTAPRQHDLRVSVVEVAPVAPAPQKGSVWLRWNPHFPYPNTIRNLTTGEEYDAGSANNFEVHGLPLGSTNTFVVHNDAGVSNEATGVASVNTNRASISIHTFLVELPVEPNVSVVLLTSTNLLTWKEIGIILTTNSVYQFVWTNDHGTRFFRSALP